MKFSHAIARALALTIFVLALTASAFAARDGENGAGSRRVDASPGTAPAALDSPDMTFRLDDRAAPSTAFRAPADRSAARSTRYEFPAPALTATFATADFSPVRRKALPRRKGSGR